MAWEDLKSNKFRTFLSLFGITIGIFCIIGVLTAINSLDRNIKKDLSTIGNNTLFISKWDWSGNGDFWKIVQRPSVSLLDFEMLQSQSSNTAQIAYTASEQNAAIDKGTQTLAPISLYGTTEAFLAMQGLSIESGRFLSKSEFDRGANLCVLGYENAKTLFEKPTNAIGQTIKIKEQELQIIGVLSPYGKNILQGWDYDHCIIIPYLFHNRYMRNKRVEPFIMAKANNKITIPQYNSELRGILRSVRKLSPYDSDNFSINDLNIFTERIDAITNYVRLGGSVIALFSLIVGAFGMSNIMYVSVKERTKLIGIKKAIGAKSSIIQLEFLVESAFLCVLGGIIGLLLLIVASIFFSKVFGFEMIIQFQEVLIAVGLCIAIGVLSGLMPARNAAKMNAVDAIRT
jgi:putative ABC transport system permease protein